MFGVYRVSSSKPVESPAGLIGSGFLTLPAIVSSASTGANALLTRDGQTVDSTYVSVRAEVASEAQIKAAAEEAKKQAAAAAAAAAASAASAAADSKSDAPVIGALTVLVVSGKNLKDMDAIGKMDPYVLLKYGKSQELKSRVLNEAGTNPNFNQSFTLELDGSSHVLSIDVMDEDVGSSDHVGRCDIPISQLIKSNDAKSYQLTAKKDGKTATGEIVIKCESFAPRSASAAGKPSTDAGATAAAAAGGGGDGGDDYGDDFD